MVKRAKLTLDHTETRERINESEIPESVVTEQSAAFGRQKHLGKILIVAGLSIASLIIFRQKFF